MGFSINNAIHMARIAPFVSGCQSGIMLGRQKMHFRPAGWTPRLIKALAGFGITATPADLFQADGFCESFLRTIGWPALKSLDFSDIEGAEFIHDLSEPVGDDLKGRFDLIFDGGTTEHVFDIAQSFRNVDAMLAEGGIFVSNVGTDGWFGHGFFQTGPDVPWRYWHHARGYEMLEVSIAPRAFPGQLIEIPDPTGQRRGGERFLEGPHMIVYAARKPLEAPPYAPPIQGHYVHD